MKPLRPHFLNPVPIGVWGLLVVPAGALAMMAGMVGVGLWQATRKGKIRVSASIGLSVGPATPGGRDVAADGRPAQRARLGGGRTAGRYLGTPHDGMDAGNGDVVVLARADDAPARQNDLSP